MPDVLSRAKTSPGEFLKAVEYRSNLLVEVGRRVVDRELTPIYEFRHLTFAEYLAARAAVGGHYQSYTPSSSLSDTLAPYLSVPAWREVFPLACVLAGRQATGLIRRLLADAIDALQGAPLPASSPPDEPDPTGGFQVVLLCLADEPNVSPDTVELVFDELPNAILKGGRQMLVDGDAFERLALSSYGDQLTTTLVALILPLGQYAPDAGSILAQTIERELSLFPEKDQRRWRTQIAKRVKGRSAKEALRAALGATHVAFSATGRSRRQRGQPRPVLQPSDLAAMRDGVTLGLWHRRPAVRWACAWALAWILPATPGCKHEVCARLAEMAVHERSWLTRRMAGWALRGALKDEEALAEESWKPQLDAAGVGAIQGLVRHAASAGKRNPGHCDSMYVEGAAALCRMWGPAALTPQVRRAFSNHQQALSDESWQSPARARQHEGYSWCRSPRHRLVPAMCCPASPK
jgi:hypothetical protein